MTRRQKSRRGAFASGGSSKTTWSIGAASRASVRSSFSPACTRNSALCERAPSPRAIRWVRALRERLAAEDAPRAHDGLVQELVAVVELECQAHVKPAGSVRRGQDGPSTSHGIV